MTQKSEPLFNVPRVVIATIAVLVFVHVVRVFVLSDEEDVRFLLTFAFIPARYGTDLAVTGTFPGGFGADLWTFFTYAFIHADMMHIGLNLAWLVPFGTALARRCLPCNGCPIRRSASAVTRGPTKGRRATRCGERCSFIAKGKSATALSRTKVSAPRA